MKFSIITPSFNQARFIADCIESVRSQKGTDIEHEHIVIDGGSKDGTVEVLQRYPDVTWVSEPDQGQSDGINKGWIRATGDWVMWLNVDDYLLPDALLKVKEHSSRHPEADVIYGECIYVDGDRKLLRQRLDHPFDLNVLLFYGCYIQSTSTFIKGEVIRAGHLIDASLRNCMDFEYYLRLARLGYKFSFLPENLAAFRWHGTNISTRFHARRHRERVAIQQAHLQATNRSWLGAEWLLSVLKRVYQAKRAVLKATSKHGTTR